MKKLLFLLLIAPAFCNAQKVYNITGVSTNLQSVKDLGVWGIHKTKMAIIVSDSTYTQIFKDTKTVYKIVKKVDENYFKISDGLKETIVKISDVKIKKYTGVIVQETDQGDVNLWFN